MELLDLVNSEDTGTDKVQLGYFETFYDKLFSPRKYTARNILEIGISHGHSILLWRNFFPNATIHAVDVNGCEAINNQERINPIIRDAYSLQFVDQLEKNYFDIIIDDGPHTFESMVFYIQNYIHLVKDGGVLVLEDIINTNWTPILLKMIDPSFNVTVFDMRNKQRDPSFLENWKGGLDVIVVEK